MLLERTENNNNIISYYDSSNILISKYLKDEQKIAIIFKSGFQYVYENINLQEFNLFNNSDSQGKVFNKIFKGKEYTKHDTVDVSEIKNYIEHLKKN